jgi:hypothetical protein
MYVNDIENDDVWGMWTMSKAMSAPVEGQAVPTALDGIFKEEPLDTIDVFIGAEGDELYLVPVAPYGGGGDVTTVSSPKGEVFRLNFLPTGFAVSAHEVQGKRQAGTMDLETIEYRRDRKLNKARMRLGATERFHAASALFTGIILDADGSSTVLDLNTKFDIARQSKAIAVGTVTNKVRGLWEEAKDLSYNGLGGATEVVGWRCVCGRGFYNDLVDVEQIEKAKDSHDGLGPNDTGYGDGFTWNGIQFTKYYGSVKKTAGSAQEFIPTNEARLMPIVTDPEAYQMFRGPAPYVGAVNEFALPYYAVVMRQDPKGMAMEACTVCLPLPRYPRSIITITK